MKKQSNYINEQLNKLLNTPSPTGNTEKAMLLVENEFKALGLSTKRNHKGGLIATLPGKNDDEHITISAHIDTLGAMVKEIKPNGRLKFSQLGGYAWSTVEGEYVNIETMDNKLYSGTILTTKASVHVHGAETTTIERNSNTMEIRLDEIVESSDDVLDLGINVGDFIYIDPRAVFTDNGFIKSRHLDDKAGVVSILAIAKYLTENNIQANNTINFYISNYEEVGHGAASSISKETVEFIAIDMAAPGEGQTSDEYSVTICAKDSSGPYDYNMRKELVNLAKKGNLKYKIDIYPSYGSDASAALRAGNDIRAALIGPGVDASHSFERTHIDAILNTVELAILYLTK